MVKSNKAKSWYKCFADPARTILWDQGGFKREGDTTR